MPTFLTCASQSTNLRACSGRTSVVRPVRLRALHGETPAIVLKPEGYKERVVQLFDSRTTYDEDNTFHTRLAAALLARVELLYGGKVLDVATGTGIVALLAAEAVGPEGHVTGIDTSPGMLAQARSKGEGLTNVEFLELDAESAGFPDASFDAILCSSALPYLPDAPKMLATWLRWLKPGGVLAVNSFKAPNTPEFGLFYELLPRYGLQPVDPCEPLGTQKRCHQVLTAAGYTDVTVWEDVMVETQRRTPVQYAEGIWRVCLTSVFVPIGEMLTQQQLAQLKAEFMEVATASAAKRQRNASSGGDADIMRTAAGAAAAGSGNESSSGGGGGAGAAVQRGWDGTDAGAPVIVNDVVTYVSRGFRLRSS